MSILPVLRAMRPGRTAWILRCRLRLQKRGVERLYTHQAQAIEAAARGEDIVGVTPTASGKTMCYNLPVLSAILKDPNARGAVSVSYQGAVG